MAYVINVAKLRDEKQSVINEKVVMTVNKVTEFTTGCFLKGTAETSIGKVFVSVPFFFNNLKLATMFLNTLQKDEFSTNDLINIELAVEIEEYNETHNNYNGNILL